MAQKTIRVADSKIKLQTRLRTRSGNPMGYVVRVDDTLIGEPRRYYVNTLHSQEAMDTAYVRHIKATR